MCSTSPAGRSTPCATARRLPRSAYEDDRAAIEPSVAKLRALIREAADSDNPPPLVVSDLVSIGGMPAILAVQPIVPNSDRVAQEPGTEYVHASVQFIDGEVIDHIARQYQLGDVHLLPQLTSALPDASVPLMGSNGVILGYVAWDQDRPGLTLIRQASPALIAGLLLAAGVLYFLLRRLRRATGELQRSQSQAQYLAFHDTLTGLPNRALFEDRLKRALLAVSRDKRKIGLLYIDLDRFKTVNDTFGHPCGDELVRQTAARLENSVRQVDTVARLGGDEFAVIVFDVKDLGTAEELCERLLREIGQPFNLLGNQVFVGASIGVAISNGPDTDPADLLRKADIALYEAKKNGRGRHEVFAGDMDDLIARKRMIESDLRAALDRRQRHQAGLPADLRVRLHDDRRRRGADPLGPSRPRRAVAGAFRLHRRGARHDRPARRLGAYTKPRASPPPPISLGSPSTCRRCSFATARSPIMFSTSCARPACRRRASRSRSSKARSWKTARRRGPCWRSCARPASASCSTISAPAIRRSTICSAMRSTS